MSRQGRGQYLAKNTLIFTLGNLGTKLVYFCMVPLYTNILSTTDYGIVDLVATIGMVLGPVLLLNINEGVMRYSLDKNADYPKIMSIGLTAFSFCVLIGLLIFPVGTFAFHLSDNYVAYIYFYSVSYAGNLLFLGYLRGTERLLAFSIGNIINAVLVAGLNILFLVVFQMGISGYFAAYTLANLLCCIYAFCAGRVWDVVRNFCIDRVLTKDMLKYSLVLIPNTFMWWIINSSDRIMITSFLGSSANGIFAVSCKIPTLLSTLVTIFNTAWSYSAIKENESKDKDAYANSVYNGMTMLALVIGGLMIFVMKPFLSIYVAADYYTAWRYTPYLIIGVVFLSLASFLGTYYTVNKDSKGFLFSSMIAAVCNLALNYFLIPWLGIAGGALATAISYIIVFIYRAVDTRKYIRIAVFSMKQGISSILLVVMGVAMFAPTIVSYVLMSICLIAILWIYKDTWMIYLATVRKQIKQKIHKK